MVSRIGFVVCVVSLAPSAMRQGGVAQTQGTSQLRNPELENLNLSQWASGISERDIVLRTLDSKQICPSSRKRHLSSKAVVH